MKISHLCVAAFGLVALICAREAGSALADTANTALAYPAEVALSEESNHRFLYRRFPGSQRLYVYDLDKDGHSACNVGCYQAWPPVLAPDNAKPIGDWTIIRRDDGSRQWAYKGRPVYTFFHDEPGDPAGDGQDGVWHLLSYMEKQN